MIKPSITAPFKSNAPAPPSFNSTIVLILMTSTWDLDLSISLQKGNEVLLLIHYINLLFILIYPSHTIVLSLYKFLAYHIWIGKTLWKRDNANRAEWDTNWSKWEESNWISLDVLSKVNPDSSFAYLRARLVTKDYSQMYGVDYHDILTLVAKIIHVWTLISLKAIHHKPLHQLVIRNAFPHGVLDDIHLGFFLLRRRQKRCINWSCYIGYNSLGFGLRLCERV